MTDAVSALRPVTIEAQPHRSSIVGQSYYDGGLGKWPYAPGSLAFYGAGMLMILVADDLVPSWVTVEVMLRGRGASDPQPSIDKPELPWLEKEGKRPIAHPMRSGDVTEFD